MIKKILSLVFVLQVAVGLFAQNEVDALRYSQLMPTGSARFTSMGGAFGALGGDLTTMATNPAGIGMYRKNDFGVSFGWMNHKNTSNLNGTKNSTSELDLQLTNIGFVSVNSSLANSEWRFLNFGFAYNQLADFNFSTTIKGLNNNSSLLDIDTEWLNNNINDFDNNPYYNADVIFWDDTDNQYYNDYNFPGNSYGANQNHTINSSGYIGEYDFSLAANYQDILYIGGTFGFQRIRFEQTIVHSETPTTDLILQHFESTEYLKTKGNGFNLKVGAIFKVNQMLRLGMAFHTPTLFNMKDDYWTDVKSTLDDGSSVINKNAESLRGHYDWEYVSPLRLSGSAAVVLGKLAIISSEVEYVDYSNMSLTSDEYLFDEENNTVDTLYTGQINFKLGTEFRVGVLSLRGGLAYYGSPFVSSQPNSDASTLVYSGGVGVNTGNMYVDFAYQSSMLNEKYYMYGREEVDVERNNSRFMVTVGFRF